jgi:hypothetical protein
MLLRTNGDNSLAIPRAAPKVSAPSVHETLAKSFVDKVSRNPNCAHETV